jgi:hypothetical protein
MKKRLFMTGMFSILLAFGLVFVGCNDSTNDDGNGNDTPNNPPVNLSKNITVYMEKPAGWSQLYAYVWDDSGKEFTAATPGTALTTASSGFYSYQAQSAEYGYVKKYQGLSDISSPIPRACLTRSLLRQRTLRTGRARLR